MKKNKNMIISVTSIIIMLLMIGVSGALFQESIALGSAVDTISDQLIPIDIFEVILRYPFRMLIWSGAYLTSELLSIAIADAYGMGIVIATVVIRFAVYPLSEKSAIKSDDGKQDEMKEAQELVKEYYSTKEQTKEVQQQEAMDNMRIQRKFGLNPTGGCLPMMIQLPIIIIFYQAIYWTPVLYEGSFFGLFQLGPTFMELIAASNKDMVAIISVLGLSLMSAFLTWYSQYYISKQQVQNEQAQQMSKMMMIMFPLMIGFMGLTLSPALTLYWTIGNIFMVVQNFYIYGSKK